MSDDSTRERPGPRPAAGDAGEEIGSVGEEAAKLFTALSDWAREQGHDSADSAARAASALSETLQDVNAHIATGGEDCRYCPVCQVIHVVRSTSPEVKAHLTVAASSLMHAAAGLLATQVSPGQRPPGVEKIDLDDDWDDR